MKIFLPRNFHNYHIKENVLTRKKALSQIGYCVAGIALLSDSVRLTTVASSRLTSRFSGLIEHIVVIHILVNV